MLSYQDKSNIVLHVDGQDHPATREEFYTNYPFYKYWKSSTNELLCEPEGINIYIHIPFCIQVCDYCFYMKELVKSKSQVDQYVDSLCKEIEMISARFSLGNRKVNSIYIGGGTPSVLTESQFSKVMETLHRYHQISRPEFTFEAEPGTFTKIKLGWYKQTGINRISMGVQSFVDEIIAMSSRKHTSRQAIQSIEMVQEAGDFIVNVDLLSGLAGETMDTWKESIEIANRQAMDTITIYKMKAYANTVFFKKGKYTNEIQLPDDKQEVEFFSYALDQLMSAGFKRWTNFAFTRSGYRHTYLENTLRGQDMIAYGVSSFGKMGNISYQNLNNLHNYQQAIEKGEMPIYRSYQLSAKDAMVRELLLCASRLTSYSKQEFIARFGFDYFDMIPEAIAQLVAHGLIESATDELRLTRTGIIYGDYVGKVLSASLKNRLASDAINFTY